MHEEISRLALFSIYIYMCVSTAQVQSHMQCVAQTRAITHRSKTETHTYSIDTGTYTHPNTEQTVGGMRSRSVEMMLLLIFVCVCSLLGPCIHDGPMHWYLFAGNFRLTFVLLFESFLFVCLCLTFSVCMRARTPYAFTLSSPCSSIGSASVRKNESVAHSRKHTQNRTCVIPTNVCLNMIRLIPSAHYCRMVSICVHFIPFGWRRLREWPTLFSFFILQFGVRVYLCVCVCDSLSFCPYTIGNTAPRASTHYTIDGRAYIPHTLTRFMHFAYHTLQFPLYGFAFITVVVLFANRFELELFFLFFFCRSLSKSPHRHDKSRLSMYAYEKWFSSIRERRRRQQQEYGI